MIFFENYTMDSLDYSSLYKNCWISKYIVELRDFLSVILLPNKLNKL